MTCYCFFLLHVLHSNEFKRPKFCSVLFWGFFATDRHVNKKCTCVLPAHTVVNVTSWVFVVLLIILIFFIETCRLFFDSYNTRECVLDEEIKA